MKKVFFGNFSVLKMCAVPNLLNIMTFKVTYKNDAQQEQYSQHKKYHYNFSLEVSGSQLQVNFFNELHINIYQVIQIKLENTHIRTLYITFKNTF